MGGLFRGVQFASCLCRSHLPDRIGQHIRILRAHHGISAFDQEARDTGHSHLLRLRDLLPNCVSIGIARQKRADDGECSTVPFRS